VLDRDESGLVRTRDAWSWDGRAAVGSSGPAAAELADLLE
jgi:hypothetical protein